MSKIDDMTLFVTVVKTGGLAAAGRQIGLSPASMTVRINAIEAKYQTRLLNRSTRSISLTDAGNRFYEGCLRVLAEVEQTEASLRADRQAFSGLLRVTASSDFGRQYVAPAIANFVIAHPEVTPYLLLSENMVNLVAEGFDIGIRLGNLPDSTLMMRSLSLTNRRVLCAAPSYLERYGTPTHPEDLKEHRCLVMERLGEQFDQWRFRLSKTEAKERTTRKIKGKSSPSTTIRVNAALTGSDGALMRQWAVAGAGIALKSYWDVRKDILSGRLVTVLDNYVVGTYTRDDKTVGLQIVYPSRKYLPRQVSGFIDYFAEYIKDQHLAPEDPPAKTTTS
ncbi:MAG: LysR family transcriptional regulator [Cyanobacteria bacterium J06606_4]